MSRKRGKMRKGRGREWNKGLRDQYIHVREIRG